MNNLERIFESIVLIIHAVFVFLPPWCLIFMGSAFAFIVGVILYKLVRG